MNFRACTLAAGLAFLVLASSQTACTAQSQQTFPLWPHNVPEPSQVTGPETDLTKPTDNLISGHRTARLTNVTVPTLTVYPPHGHNTGAAALVFPGGGYHALAWDGEGLDACAWLNSLGMTCVLVKYRVPQEGRYPDNPADLEDAQQAMRLTRAHAADWHIDPNRIGVIGFSAGAHLAVLLSTHPDDTHVASTPAAPDVNASIDARPNFAFIVYPGYLAVEPGRTDLDPVLTPNQLTPPTFLLQAENDPVHVENSLVYFRALKQAKVPTEFHVFATGGHGFGLHPVGSPEEHWTQLGAAWLRSIAILPPLQLRHVAGSGPSTGTATPNVAPCPTVPQPPQPGNPNSSNNNANTAINQPLTDPSCW